MALSCTGDNINTRAEIITNRSINHAIRIQLTQRYGNLRHENWPLPYLHRWGREIARAVGVQRGSLLAVFKQPHPTHAIAAIAHMSRNVAGLVLFCPLLQ